MIQRMKALAFASVTAIPLISLAGNDAAFVSWSVPAQVATGAPFDATITMKNTGTTTWSLAQGHFLGSENPMDNTTWGTNRIFMDGAAAVAPGAEYAFTKRLAAPAAAGSYRFQWRMLQEAVEWFGATTPDIEVQVSAPAFTCDGTETVCLDLRSQAAVEASGGVVVGGDFTADGFQPADQGGIDWRFSRGADISAGRFEVEVTGLLPQTDPGQPEQVSIFEVCGTGADGIQVAGLQRMMMDYHGDNIFRYYATTDFNAYGWQLGIWTDGFEVTGWTPAEKHRFTASWDTTSIGLTIDGSTWGNNGTFPFNAAEKVFTLGERCTHYPTQQAVARFSNFRLWALGAEIPDAGTPDTGAEDAGGDTGADDAGADAAAPDAAVADAGAHGDTGTAQDAGQPSDGGAGTDTGTPADAGSPDLVDADAAAADARRDAGAEGSGCSCATLRL